MTTLKLFMANQETMKKLGIKSNLDRVIPNYKGCGHEEVIENYDFHRIGNNVALQKVKLFIFRERI